MSSTILFIFEGEKTEKKITDSLTSYFVNEYTNVKCAFCADVYQLYVKISNDPDLDTFSIIKNRPQNNAILSGYNRSDFGEIYLFFDYDGHATNASDNTIKDLTQFFDEETESGKIYFSYPMVESIKHLNTSINFKELKVKAKQNINYKKVVSEEGAGYLKNLSALSNDHWKEIMNNHLKKMNYIVNSSYSFPTLLISQKDIFENQLLKYISVDETIAVLSAFPIFILDYYGVAKTLNIIDN